GEKIGDNMTQPLTDTNEIHNILKIFNIEPYQKHETGTTAIMPYIDENEILEHNQITAPNGKNPKEIYKNLSMYLEYSLQRWYSPRLNNKHYRFGNKKYLTASINNEDITYTR